MATGIPPHNIIELLKLVYYWLMTILLSNDYQVAIGPDFPTGGIVLDDEVIKVYKREEEALDYAQNIILRI